MQRRDGQREGRASASAASAIGYTIYPGSGARNVMYEELRELVLEAKDVGLPTVVWAYPRGAGLSKEGETAIDVVAYAAQISCQLGAHVVKVKPPKDFIEQAEAKKVFEKYGIPTKTMADRVKHVRAERVQRQAHRHLLGRRGQGHRRRSSRRCKGSRPGGAFGSIMGRNAFQRPRAEALKLLVERDGNLPQGGLIARNDWS